MSWSVHGTNEPSGLIMKYKFGESHMLFSRQDAVSVLMNSTSDDKYFFDGKTFASFFIYYVIS